MIVPSLVVAAIAFNAATTFAVPVSDDASESLTARRGPRGRGGSSGSGRSRTEAFGSALQNAGQIIDTVGQVTTAVQSLNQPPSVYKRAPRRGSRVHSGSSSFGDAFNEGAHVADEIVNTFGPDSTISKRGKGGSGSRSRSSSSSGSSRRKSPPSDNRRHSSTTEKINTISQAGGVVAQGIDLYKQFKGNSQQQQPPPPPPTSTDAANPTPSDATQTSPDGMRRRSFDDVDSSLEARELFDDDFTLEARDFADADMLEAREPEYLLEDLD